MSAKINDLSKGLKDLGNQINNSNGSPGRRPRRFQKIYNFATEAGANDTTGSPAILSANVAPLAGVSGKLAKARHQHRGRRLREPGAPKCSSSPNAIPVPGLDRADRARSRPPTAFWA